jgi:hypothetical protein
MKLLLLLHLKSEAKKYWQGFYSFINLYFVLVWCLIHEVWTVHSMFTCFVGSAYQYGLKIHHKNNIQHEKLSECIVLL